MADQFDEYDVRGFYGDRRHTVSELVSVHPDGAGHGEVISPRPAEYTALERGRCASCGFLGKRWLDPTRGVVEEALNVERYAGTLYTGEGGTYTRPWCFVGANPLEWEIRELQQKLEPGSARPEPNAVPDSAIEATARIIGWRRDCPEWFPWTPFLTPKEHRAEREMMKLEEARRAHDLRLAEMEREARVSAENIQRDSLEIAKATQATMDGLKEITGKTDRFQSRWTRVAVILAVAGVVLVAATWMFPELGRHFGEWLDRSLGYPFGQYAP